MKHVAVVDYGMGNLDSVVRAVEECGGDPVIMDSAAEIRRASLIILPGVGAFADGMRCLRERNLEDVLRQAVLDERVPLLGLCLGMHLLADVGMEGGETAGLGFIPGRVVRLVPDGNGVRIPHVGWNAVHGQGESALLAGIESGKDFYFVHSYQFVCSDEGDVKGRTPYCGGVASVIERGNVRGVQFHPEKSQKAGFQLLRNFLDM